MESMVTNNRLNIETFSAILFGKLKFYRDIFKRHRNSNCFCYSCHRIPTDMTSVALFSVRSFTNTFLLNNAISF
jgi:hypothetical protein